MFDKAYRLPRSAPEEQGRSSAALLAFMPGKGEIVQGQVTRRSFIGATFAGVALLRASSALAARGSSGGGAIERVRVGPPITVPDNFGDTWVTTLADDGGLYTPANDTLGFGLAPFLDRDRIQGFQGIFPASTRGLTAAEVSKFWYGPLAFCRVVGDSPFSLRGETVNRMAEYRHRDGYDTMFAEHTNWAADNRSWKSSGCMFLDGALYWAIHRDGGDDGPGEARQTVRDASIIKSTDHGRTWTRSEDKNFHAPMFPGATFPSPYFVDYGRSRGIDGSDRYVYATSNNGFWDNGDFLILARVARRKIGHLDAADWEFFIGGDGEAEGNWRRDPAEARPILTDQRRIGGTGVAYLPLCRRYVLIAWNYPSGPGHTDGASSRSVWDIYEAPKPWGPWTLVGTKAWEPQGYYCPVVCPKFQSRDRVYAVTAGDFRNWWGNYQFTLVPIDLA